MKSECECKLVSKIPELLIESHLIKGLLRFLLPTLIVPSGRLAFHGICSERIWALFEFSLEIAEDPWKVYHTVGENPSIQVYALDHQIGIS